MRGITPLVINFAVLAIRQCAKGFSDRASAKYILNPKTLNPKALRPENPKALNPKP